MGEPLGLRSIGMKTIWRSGRSSRGRDLTKPVASNTLLASGRRRSNMYSNTLQIPRGKAFQESPKEVGSEVFICSTVEGCSCNDSPPPGRSCLTGMPSACNAAPAPNPDNSSNNDEPYVPAHRMTSRATNNKKQEPTHTKTTPQTQQTTKTKVVTM